MRRYSDVQILILQQCYGLTTLKLKGKWPIEYRSCHFSAFPIHFPISGRYGYSKNAWRRPRKDKVVWAELQRQLDAMGLKVKRGTIQDATFIEADPGSSKKSHDGGSRTRHGRDGIWTKKGRKSYFGYKLHQKNDTDYGQIREIKTTTAKVHDSQVDLSVEGEAVIRTEAISVCLPEVMISPWCEEQLMSLSGNWIKSAIG